MSYLFINLGADKPKTKGNWVDIPYINDDQTLTLYYSEADLFTQAKQKFSG